ncbi:MAG: tetratricopeptide repeat protein [Bacteroidaceae bacterium]|nr:tetratricopeptide repeat protein [Bacteroidaceae bacterium]
MVKSKWFIAVAVVMMLTACHAPKKAAVPEKGTVAKVGHLRRTPLSQNDRMRLSYLYEEAARQKMLGNHVAAFDLLQHCMEIDSAASEVLYDMALYRLMLRQDSVAEKLLHHATEADPQNVYYMEALAAFYLERRQTELALPYLEQMAAMQPKRTDVLSQLVNIYSSLDRPQDAIRVLDRIELLDGKTAAASYRKYALYTSLQDEKRAFDELEALCREYPHEMSYRLAIGNQLLKVGRADEALQVFEQVRAIEPNSEQLQLSMLQYYHDTGADSVYVGLRDSLLFAPQTTNDMRVQLLRGYIGDVMDDEKTGRTRVHDTFDRLDSIQPRSLDLLQLRAAYLATYEKEDEAAFVSVMDRINELEPANTQALFYLIQYYGTHKEFARLEDLCRRGVLTHPEELICHFYLGVACYQQDKKQEALKAFEDGLVQKTEESRPTMVADLYSIMGDVLHELGRENEAYAAYDSCLTYQDDNVGCLNNYAYYLSLQNQQLDKAEEMSYRTIRLEPNNKTYLDTYAWILFMKQRYSEAQIYIDRVCPPDSADSVLMTDPSVSGVVLEHAGDIADKNDLPQQALRFWQLAQAAGGDGITALLPKKIRQIREKLDNGDNGNNGKHGNIRKNRKNRK